MVRGDGESEESAERRMREVWSRTLAWEVEGEQLIYGGEENELVRLAFAFPFRHDKHES
jgi:protein farnesyltransferase subunit beta